MDPDFYRDWGDNLSPGFTSQENVQYGGCAMKKLWIIVLAVILIASTLLFFYFRSQKDITLSRIKAAEKLIGLTLTKAERKMMLSGLERNLANYQEMREFDLPNQIPMALIFYPVPQGYRSPQELTSPIEPIAKIIQMPEKLEDLAFYPVSSLAQLLQAQRITSEQLTRMYIERLKKYGPHLNCIVSLTEDLAISQAKQADEEIAAGKYRGPLHGIPWGAKDLLATRGIKTTWGAMPYKDQVLDEDATVVKRLQEAGAVLVAKLSLGALAMGDVWFEGRTRSPWNLEQGSSGSSAGSASATAAGLVAFAIGTETLGSIVSPSTRCGVTGLRPSYGRVSRYGAMALSWSMDKIGPICRTAEDCALVFHAIMGPDGKDHTILDYPFLWNPSQELKNLKIGYLKEAFGEENRNRENDLATLEVFKSLGIELIPIDLPDMPLGPMRIILNAEAAAAFDELTRTDKDELLVRQNQGSWPNSFRQARFIPAVEYIQANRMRSILIQKMAEVFQDIDVYISPSFGNRTLLITNLTGHPTVVVPNGFSEQGSPTSISFVGDLFAEADTLRVAHAYQSASDFHNQHPDLDKNIALYQEKQEAEEEKT